MSKQFPKKRPNARAVLASNHVPYRACGMVDRVKSPDASVKRTGCHFAMQDVRKRQKTGTNRLQMETHGWI